MKNLLVVLGTFTLAACGGGTAEAPKEAAIPAKLPAGTYEVTATVKTLASADKTPLPTFAKQGDVMKTTGCVGADGVPAPELLATKGDSCRVKEPYIRSGRMNLTLDCQRKGQGQVVGTLDGSYTADGFKGTLSANSNFPGPGDYKLVEDIVARKTSDQCTAAPEAPKKA